MTFDAVPPSRRRVMTTDAPSSVTLAVSSSGRYAATNRPTTALLRPKVDNATGSTQHGRVSTPEAEAAKTLPTTPILLISYLRPLRSFKPFSGNSAPGSGAEDSIIWHMPSHPEAIGVSQRDISIAS